MAIGSYNYSFASAVAKCELVRNIFSWILLRTIPSERELDKLADATDSSLRRQMRVGSSGSLFCLGWYQMGIVRFPYVNPGF